MMATISLLRHICNETDLVQYIKTISDRNIVVSLSMVEYGLAVSEVLKSMLFMNIIPYNWAQNLIFVHQNLIIIAPQELISESFCKNIQQDT